MSILLNRWAVNKDYFVGVFGYLTFGKNITPDILMSYSGSDVTMIIARLLFGISIVTIYPIIVLLARFAANCVLWLLGERFIAHTVYWLIGTSVDLWFRIRCCGDDTNTQQWLGLTRAGPVLPWPQPGSQSLFSSLCLFQTLAKWSVSSEESALYSSLYFQVIVCFLLIRFKRPHDVCWN